MSYQGWFEPDIGLGRIVVVLVVGLGCRYDVWFELLKLGFKGLIREPSADLAGVSNDKGENIPCKWTDIHHCRDRSRQVDTHHTHQYAFRGRYMPR